MTSIPQLNRRVPRVLLFATCRCILLVALTTGARAQWIPVDGNFSGNPTAFVVVPPAASDSTVIIIAGTKEDGLFRSTDRGRTWERSAERRLTGDPVTALEYVDGWIFAGTEAGSIYVSQDRGSTWLKSWPLIGTINAFTIAPDSAGTMLAGTNRGLYYSTDSGPDWIPADFPKGLIGSLHRCPSPSGGRDLLFAGASARAIWRSKDGGASWQSANSGLGSGLNLVTSLISIPGDSTGSSRILFAGLSGGGVFRSTDYGENWMPAAGGLTSTIVWHLVAGMSSPAGPNLLLAGTSNLVFRSTDHGDHWIATSITEYNESQALAFIPGSLREGGGVFLVGGYYNAYRSDDDGARWEQSGLESNRIPGGRISALAVVPPDSAGKTALIAVTSGIGGRSGCNAYRTTDRGATWKQLDIGIHTNIVASGDELFLCRGGDEFGRTTDGGNSWIRMGKGLAPAGPVQTAIMVRDSITMRNTLYAGLSAGGVLRSSDMGGHWEYDSTGLWGARVNSFISLPGPFGKEAYLFAGTPKGVFRSTGSGGGWVRMVSGLANPDVNTFVSIPSTTPDGSPTLLAGTWGSGVFFSTNYGETWNPANTGMEKECISALVAWRTSLFAGTTSLGILLSADQGRSWIPFNGGLGDLTVYGLALNGAELFAGTHHSSVWRRELKGDITTTQDLQFAGASVVSLEVFPQPLRDRARIRFGLPSPATVRIGLYDLLGREVLPPSVRWYESGSHEESIELRRLPAGVYNLRLTAGVSGIVRRILRVK